MFIQTQQTPNPQTLKFIPGMEVAPTGPKDFFGEKSDQRRPRMVEALFELEGVERVFLGHDFVAITKDEQLGWDLLKIEVIDLLTAHFSELGKDEQLLGLSGDDGAQDGEKIAQAYQGEAREIVEQILDLINNRVRPAVAQDGGDIVFHDYDEKTGIVRLTMQGACAGCPSSAFTLKQGIENLLKHYVPEVTAVEPVI